MANLKLNRIEKSLDNLNLSELHTLYEQVEEHLFNILEQAAAEKVDIRTKGLARRRLPSIEELKARAEIGTLAKSLMTSGILPALGLSYEITMFAKDLDYLAAVYRGGELKAQIPFTRAGDLNGLYTDFRMMCDRLKMTVEDYQDIQAIVHLYIEAIRALHNQNDGGKALRQLAQERNEFASQISDWRDNLKLLGNVGPKSTQWGDWIRNNGRRIRAETPNLNARQVIHKLCLKIATYNGDYTIKPGMEAYQPALDSLRGSKAMNNPANYLKSMGVTP